MESKVTLPKHGTRKVTAAEKIVAPGGSLTALSHSLALLETRRGQRSSRIHCLHLRLAVFASLATAFDELSLPVVGRFTIIDSDLF